MHWWWCLGSAAFEHAFVFQFILWENLHFYSFRSCRRRRRSDHWSFCSRLFFSRCLNRFFSLPPLLLQLDHCIIIYSQLKKHSLKSHLFMQNTFCDTPRAMNLRTPFTIHLQTIAAFNEFHLLLPLLCTWHKHKRQKIRVFIQLTRTKQNKNRQNEWKSSATQRQAQSSSLHGNNLVSFSKSIYMKR